MKPKKVYNPGLNMPTTITGTPVCRTDRRDHFGLCTTLQIDTSTFFDHTEAEHAGIELCFAAGGTRHQRRFRGKKWVIEEDKLMVFNARERHIEECSVNPTQRDLRAVIIHPGFLDTLFEDTGLDADELSFNDILIRPAPDLRRALEALFSSAATPGISRVTLDCVLTELVMELTSRLSHSASAKLRVLEARGFYPGSVARAQEIFRKNMDSQDLDLHQAAALAGLSKFHFVRAFREKTGVTPIRYLNRLRVDAAKQKLHSGAAPVTEIALDVGFADLSAFNKAFKRHAGLSPTQYRNFFRAPPRK